METCCVVCAEALNFCAFGPCQHTDVCSKCVIRLRLIEKNLSCPICRVDCPHILVTRYMDSHTRRVAPDQWETLKEKARLKEGGLRYFDAVNAVFDDAQHYDEMLHLSGMTHPKLEERTEVWQLNLNSIKSLEEAVKTYLDMRFCHLCLAHRPVFPSEQCIYTPKELKQHMSEGDTEGPLKEANFKGHPHCRFCNKYFYDSTLLYKHMEQVHYSCHICRKLNPDKYKYFKDYRQLEQHFRDEHWICEREQCLAAKFIAFATEAELKKHCFEVHKEGDGKGRYARRAALRLETGFTTGRDAPSHSFQNDVPEFQMVARPPTVIGGGGAGAIDINASRQRAIQDEEQRQVAAVQRSQPLDISADRHFPVLASGPVHAPMGTLWGTTGPGRGGPSCSHTFPSLGEQNNKKKKQKPPRKRDVVKPGRRTAGAQNATDFAEPDYTLARDMVQDPGLPSELPAHEADAIIASSILEQAGHASRGYGPEFAARHAATKKAVQEHRAATNFPALPGSSSDAPTAKPRAPAAHMSTGWHVKASKKEPQIAPRPSDAPELDAFPALSLGPSSAAAAPRWGGGTQSDRSTGAGPGPSSGLQDPVGEDSWAPPEATEAAAAGWQCIICTLLNSAADEICAACKTPKLVTSAQSKPGKKKKTKVTLTFQDVNRQLKNGSTQNSWAQGRPQ